MRPDVVRRGKVEPLRPGLPHQPWNEGVDLLCGPWARAEDQRIGLTAFVLLGIDVERPALDDGRFLDGLPGGAEDAADDYVDLIALDQLAGDRGRDGVVGRSVLDDELQRLPE